MATAVNGNLNSAVSMRKGPLTCSSGRANVRRARRISPEAGRGLEILGHAIEYLADEFSLECMTRGEEIHSGRNPRIAAIEMLKRLNREVYFSCPEVPTLGERLRSMLRLERA